jgi:hypothetical protein
MLLLNILDTDGDIEVKRLEYIATISLVECSYSGSEVDEPNSDLSAGDEQRSILSANLFADPSQPKEDAIAIGVERNSLERSPGLLLRRRKLVEAVTKLRWKTKERERLCRVEHDRLNDQKN